MSTRKQGMVTIWFPVDPEKARAEGIRKASYGVVSSYPLESYEESLQRQGYRLNASDRRKLIALCDRFEARYRELVAAMRYEKDPDTKAQLWEVDEEEAEAITGVVIPQGSDLH